MPTKKLKSSSENLSLHIYIIKSFYYSALLFSKRYSKIFSEKKLKLFIS